MMVYWLVMVLNLCALAHCFYQWRLLLNFVVDNYGNSCCNHSVVFDKGLGVGREIGCLIRDAEVFGITDLVVSEGSCDGHTFMLTTLLLFNLLPDPDNLHSQSIIIMFSQHDEKKR